MKNFLTASILVFSTFQCFAYPITPRPLRNLVIESDFIIIGFVEKVYSKVSKDDSWNDNVAKIRLLEVLKGKIVTKTVEVEFSRGMICPAPDRYEERTLVLAFLDTSGKIFRTHALSYGAKTLPEVDITIYKQRILELQEILKMPSSKQQDELITEWLVTCAEDRATRWEGTYDLEPSVDFGFSGYSKKTTNYGAAITPTQRMRLRNALLKTDNLNSSDLSLLKFIDTGRDCEVDMFLLQQLKKLSTDRLWTASEIMGRLSDYNKNNTVNKLLEDYNALLFEYDKERVAFRKISKFIKFVEGIIPNECNVCKEVINISEAL